MSSFGLFILCLLVPLGFGMWAQHKVKSTFRRYAEVPEDSGMNGAQIAERILIANGLTTFRCAQSQAGSPTITTRGRAAFTFLNRYSVAPRSARRRSPHMKLATLFSTPRLTRR